MNKKIFSIWSVLLILVVSIAVVVPGCGDGACTGDIEVRATLCDALWEGDVVYKLTGPGAAAPTIIDGTSVNATHSGVDCGDWTCEYVSGGPPGAYWESITPDPTQEVTSGSTKTFTLNFELNQDAWIEFDTWTINDEIWESSYLEAMECDVIDVHFAQGVNGCEERIVAVNETSWLMINYLGWSDSPMGEPLCQIVPDPLIYVVNDLCAVNKTPEYGSPPVKVSQNTTHWGEYVYPNGLPIPLLCLEEKELDVETIWMLEKEVDYLKSINWFGISLVEPMPHDCVLFELVIPVPVPGWYYFVLGSAAQVELMDDEDVNTNNNLASSGLLFLTVFVPF